jgi:hypothetical protein
MSFRIIAGDTRVVTIPLELDGLPYTPPVGSNIIFTCKAFFTDADADAIFQKTTLAGITVSGSNALVSVVRSDTIGVDPGPYFYDVQVQQPDGNIYTTASSSLSITNDITVELDPSVTIYTTNPTPYQSAIDAAATATAAADVATTQAGIATAGAETATTQAGIATTQAGIASDAATGLSDALTAINGKVSKAGDTMTGPLILSGDPATDLAAATKSYVDANSIGVSILSPVRVATYTTAVLSGLATIDGVTLSSGDRVLIKDQSNPVQNGIYIVGVSTWTRAADADTWSELRNSFVFVTEGNINAGNGYITAIPSTGTVGSYPINFELFTTAIRYTAGDGITITGPTIAVTARLKALNDFTGTGYAYRSPDGVWSAAATIPAAAVTGLATVATTGSFTDLLNVASHDAVTNSNGTSTSTKPGISLDHRVKVTVTGSAGIRLLEFYSPTWTVNTVIEVRYRFPTVSGIVMITKDNTGNVMDTIATDASGDDALVTLRYDTDGMKLVSSLYPAF